MWFILLQYLLPQHLLSRAAGYLAESKTPWLKRLFIRWFARRYRVDMSEAAESDLERYASFNAFFTRALREGARAIAAEPQAIACPADGTLCAYGEIQNDTIFQAKGKAFSLAALLGGDAARAAPFRGGRFAIVYLSPRDYHRVHIPCSGTLREMLYVPGRLFSVNQKTTENVDALFARNERAVCLFDTPQGPMAVILVGAMIVAGIETVWAGQVAPSARGVSVNDYRQATPPIHLAKGVEMGRFKLGSTAIVLFGPNMMQWDELRQGQSLRMGQRLGEFTAGQPSWEQHE
ncbi:MAG: archaetidylserine decarboxylase [Pseudomonadales bacterium]|jgi:phosphatidylserine decarboxylase|nr:archaetidylserine decarboxylase [Pseudomonadales bacterium]